MNYERKKEMPMASLSPSGQGLQCRSHVGKRLDNNEEELCRAPLESRWTLLGEMTASQISILAPWTDM